MSTDGREISFLREVAVEIEYPDLSVGHWLPVYYSTVLGITILAKNVFGEDLLVCSADPLTGFFRTGKCETCGDDHGMHTVCAVMTADFLKFSKLAGNDLSTPVPEYRFPGLKAGDRWCLCLPRWLEALEAGMAPKLALRATHISAIEHISMEILLEYAIDADGYVYEPPEVEE